MPTSHEIRILDQFTKLASTFGTAPQFTDAQSLDLLLRAARARMTDRSLDVACGAGVVACHFARTVQVARYEDAYRLCYVRGPEGIRIGFARELGQA